MNALLGRTEPARLWLWLSLCVRVLTCRQPPSDASDLMTVRAKQVTQTELVSLPDLKADGEVPVSCILSSGHTHSVPCMK